MIRFWHWLNIQGKSDWDDNNFYYIKIIFNNSVNIPSGSINFSDGSSMNLSNIQTKVIGNQTYYYYEYPKTKKITGLPSMFFYSLDAYLVEMTESLDLFGPEPGSCFRMFQGTFTVFSIPNATFGSLSDTMSVYGQVFNFFHTDTLILPKNKLKQNMDLCNTAYFSKQQIYDIVDWCANDGNSYSLYLNIGTDSCYGSDLVTANQKVQDVRQDPSSYVISDTELLQIDTTLANKNWTLYLYS